MVKKQTPKALIKQSTVVLFGDKNNPDVKSSINKVAITGRKVELQRSPGHDTGQGNCGKQCHCQTHCAMAYQDDKGPTMGMSY
jgi:hypothetical protein